MTNKAYDIEAKLGEWITQNLYQSWKKLCFAEFKILLQNTQYTFLIFKSFTLIRPFLSVFDSAIIDFGEDRKLEITLDTLRIFADTNRTWGKNNFKYNNSFGEAQEYRILPFSKITWRWIPTILTFHCHPIWLNNLEN